MVHIDTTNAINELSFLDNESTWVVQTFIELVKIPSPSLHERAVADYIHAFCREHNIACEEDTAHQSSGGSAGNVIARIPGEGGKTILFSAHMDTVGPCDNIKPVIREGVIYSDGTTILGGDDKSGIAAMLTLMKQAKSKPSQYPNLVFVFSFGEEIGLLGARGLHTDVLHGVEAAFILDASGKPGQCVIAAPYMASGTIVVKGKEAHAGNAPELGINAFVVAAKAVSQLPSGRIDEETTCNFGTVHGGLANNIVMPSVVLGFEARSLKKEKLLRILEQAKDTFIRVCREENAALEYNIEIDTPGYQLDESSTIVQHVQQAAAQIGITATTKHSGGGSDTNIYHAKGVPALTLATGMAKVHTVEEYMEIQDLLACVKLVDVIAKTYR